MYTRLALLSLALFALSACGTQPGKPDTRTWTTLSCSGFLLWKDCWEQAQKLCPGGFDIANQIELRGPQKREVEVACKILKAGSTLTARGSRNRCPGKARP